MLRTGGVCGGPGSCDSREEVSQEKGGKIFSSPYMADYILGEQGKISQVRLDKVDLR